MSKSWDTFGERLAWAIQQQPHQGRRRGLRLFAKRSDKGLSTVQSYIRNATSPPIDFVEHAARLLRVRAAWLACGDGWPTEEEDRTAHSLVMVPEGFRERMNRLPELFAAAEKAKVRALADQLPGFFDLSHVARAAVLRGYETYWRLPPTLDEFGDSTPAESMPMMIERYAAFLGAPFTLVSVPPESVDPVARAMILESSLRVIDILRWATEPKKD